MKAVTPLLLGLLMVLAGCDDSGGGLRRTGFPRIEASPNPITLVAVPVGQQTRRLLRLSNQGGSELIITHIEFSNAIDTREFSMEVLAGGSGADGGVEAQFPLRLSANDEPIGVLITYAPQDDVDDGGAILITSNDQTLEGGVLEVPIRTGEAAVDLIISPNQLLFNADDDASPQTQGVTVQNVGNVPVSITDVLLMEGTSADFSLVGDSAARPTLNDGDAVTYEVQYAPVGENRDEGTLVIVTDSEYGQILIPLDGVQPSPEIFVSPDSVVFGAVDLNSQSDPVSVLIENQGSRALRVTGVEFSLAQPGVNEQFTIQGLPETFPIEIAPDGAYELTLLYHPTEDGQHATNLVIQSNDIDEPQVLVPVAGRVRKPCISVNPLDVSFGAVSLQQESARSPIQITNCGDLPLLLSEIVLEGEGFDWAPIGGGARADIEVPPRGVTGVEVWYLNVGLAEGERADGVLSILNNTPGDDLIEVGLHVIGGGVPTCDIRIIPERVNFGLVSRGQLRIRDIELINVGTGECQLRSERIVPLIEIPIPGFNNVKFILTGPAGAIRVAPRGRIPVQLTYRPDAFVADQSTYEVTYFDPFLNEERQATALLTGLSGESNIEVIPGHLAFGDVTAGECASREERITVYNIGIVNLCISDIYLEGPNCDEFFVTERPVADEEGCIVVTRNQPADVRLVYEPANLGADECELVFESTAEDNPVLRVPLTGQGVENRGQTDVFEQSSGRTVDVLFVIDNSGSMSEEQENLQANFGNFISGAQQFQNDYQIGIVTTDMDAERDRGRLRDPRIMNRAGNIEAIFSDAADVGTNGSGEEHGLEAAQKALSDPLVFDTGVACNADADCIAPDTCVEGFCGGRNRGFLREDAALEVVFVSDEDDFSPATLDFYVDFFKNIKGFRNEGLFHAHAIVGASNGRAASCSSRDGDASPGRRYVDVATRTNGGVFSICDNTFGNTLRDIGNQAFGLPVQFFLTRPAVAASIEVTIDGRIVNNWNYDQNSNSVVFDVAPQPGETISVDYQAQCFPRRGG